MKKLISLLLVLVLAGCSVIGPSAVKAHKAVTLTPLTQDNYYEFQAENPLDQSVIDAIKKFSQSSSSVLLSDKDNQNFSPMSLYFALAMVATGAEEDTAQELFATLGLSPDKDALAEAMNRLSQRLNFETKTSRVQLANSIWNQKDLSFREDYIKRLTEKFQASLFEVDFTTEAAAKEMSQWVAEQTNNLLKPDFGDTSDFASVLLNTIYFKESWQEEFDPKNTTRDTFRGVDGQSEKDFLKAKREYRYINTSGVQGVVIPFELSSMIVLKSSDQSPKDILKHDLTELVNSAQTAMVDLSLPKFQFDNQYDLVEAMKQLGVTDAFDPNKANFSAMSETDLFISQIKQDTHIALDETGVEAAAVTSVIMSPTSAPMPSDEVVLKFDEPFLFIIQSPEGLPLFIGTLNQ